MMNSRHMLVGVLFATVALLFVAGTAVAQDPVKLAPNNYKVLLENDRVRVIEWRTIPKEKEPMHSHPGYVVYSLSDYRIKHTLQDGRSEEREAKAGAAGYREAVTHVGENVGTTEARAVLIELRGAATPVATTPLAQDPVKVTPNTTKVLLENDRVRVLDVRVKPGDKEPMHSHPANVVYYLSDSKMKFTYLDGKSEVREAKAGQARWVEQVTHASENVGATENHIVQVELKGAATLAKK